MKAFLLRGTLLVWLLSGWSYGSSPPALHEGAVYDKGGASKTLLFKIEADLKSPGPGLEVFSSRYLNPDGSDAMDEEASFDHLKLLHYSIRQRQLGESYELSVQGEKMRFSVTRAGATEVKETAVPANLVIGPSLVPFLREHWKEIVGGETIRAQLAVLDRMDTYGFEFEKVRESAVSGAGSVVVRMKPSSFFVSAVVRPSYLTVSADGSRILEIQGRMMPKKRESRHWVDFEGDAVFIYSSP